MSRPWEEPPLRPWEMQQPLYPRLVTITRPQTSTTPGDQGYSGTQQANESVVLTGLLASIQFTSRLSTPLGGTPSDAIDRAGFRVLIPASAAANGSITERDVVVDDLGKRYQVTAAWWDSLGYNLQAELLEA
jgi:hypothetical protein